MGRPAARRYPAPGRADRRARSSLAAALPPCRSSPLRRSAAREGDRPLCRAGHPGHHQALVAPTEVINVKPQACSCGQTECPNTRPYHTHEVIERPESQMTVSPLSLKLLLPLQPDGVLVLDARVRGQVPQPWSRWQALLTPEDRTSCCREDLLPLGPSGKARWPGEPRPTRCAALIPHRCPVMPGARRPRVPRQLSTCRFCQRAYHTVGWHARQDIRGFRHWW
jgi:hypothetical protein